MKLRTKLATWTAAGALGVGSLFAATTGPTTSSAPMHRQWQNQHQFARFMESYLNLTPQQRTQDKAIFQSAREQSMPVRQQLMQTRHSLRDAIKANDMASIQKLSSSQGNEIGQLTAIRSDAMAKAYQNLNPAQRQKLAEFEHARQASRQHERPAPGTSGPNATR